MAGDWAFIPSSWKVIGAEDPALGIPTTYYGAVQLAGTATVHDERTAPGSVAAILRRQLTSLQPGVEVADPAESHAARLLGILGLSIAVEQVSAKFKYGGNVDEPHRRAVVERLEERGAPGDDAAAAHVCGAWKVEGAEAKLKKRSAFGYATATAAARLASVVFISASACSALWSPMTRASVANHFLR